MPDPSFPHVILGAGAMGSAAAYHLARRGEPVLLIEQFPLGHDRGSSHGAARFLVISVRSKVPFSWLRMKTEATTQLRAGNHPTNTTCCCWLKSSLFASSFTIGTSSAKVSAINAGIAAYSESKSAPGNSSSLTFAKRKNKNEPRTAITAESRGW